MAGVPTTAACPEYAYTPDESAPCVNLLLEAGAIFIGKTNLDQFALGLVGVRSPYGVARNPFHPDYIPGGSSSGSAVAVAAGLVSFALGTDTAGSGRVPAGFNNIVGLKPSRGLVSTRGVVPACRTLDCISVFALEASDAIRALETMAAPDEDPYSRTLPAGASLAMADISPEELKAGVPLAGQRDFLGDDEAQSAYEKGVERIEATGAAVREVDFSPFFEAAKLLYGGPWMAERLAALDEFIGAKPEVLHPVTRELIAGAARYSAVDAFRAFYRLEGLKREAKKAWKDIDFYAGSNDAYGVYNRGDQGRPRRFEREPGDVYEFCESFGFMRRRRPKRVLCERVAHRDDPARARFQGGVPVRGGGRVSGGSGLR